MLSWLRGEEKLKVDMSEFYVFDSYWGFEGLCFKVLEKNEDYEVCLYECLFWVKMRFEEGNLENFFSVGFWCFFNYIRGENEGGYKIVMIVLVNF